MAENLTVHATTQRDHAQALVTAARAALDAANAALGTRVPDPATVAHDAWRSTLGAAQYLAASVALDADLRAAEASLRTQLATIPTPADHASLVTQLTANLLAQAESRVLRRDAQELLAIVQGDVAAAGAQAAATSADLAAAEQWLDTASQWQDAITAEKAQLTATPLDTVADDAAALKADAAYTDAEASLRARLPDALVDRSAQRYDEAAFVTTHYPRVAAAAQAAGDTVAAAGDPLVAAAATADRDLAAARADLRTYVGSAPKGLARAGAILARVKASPGLTADEIAMLDPVSALRPDAADAVAAVPHEQAVTTAWQAYVDKDVAVAAAVYSALAADPDADPQTAAAVVTAKAARDDAAVAGALNTARTDYTAADQAALDAWEAAAPGWLWDAARDFHEAAALLTHLAEAATVTDLVSAVDDATDRVAAAHDALSTHRRAAIRLAAERARADARADALAASAPQRVDAFVRGDDLGGRHGDEF